MATFIKRGDLQWQVKIRRKGVSPQSRTFNTRADAETWARQIENEMDRGVYLSRKEAENTTLDEALERYENEVSVHKKGHPQERKRIRQWRNHPLANRFLATLRSSDFAKYRDNRLKSVSPTTVRLELAIISHLFEIARKEWGMEGILNPVKSIRLPKPSEARDRRLGKNELESLLQQATSPYSEIFQFAIETGMRRGEISVMRWEHVNLKNRTLCIPETKTGKSRIVPLSSVATEILSSLARNIDGSVWGVGADSISHAFSDVCKKAKLEDLRFHDLRHEATSRFFEQGLNVMEVSSITGHQTLQMLRRYTHLKAEDLVKKLDGNPYS